jgi:hypothetical protein
LLGFNLALGYNYTADAGNSAKLQLSFFAKVAAIESNQLLPDFSIMLGNFQRSELRIEVPATPSIIRDRLLSPTSLKKWLFPQQVSFTSQDLLTTGVEFQTSLGPVMVKCRVDRADTQSLRILLSQGVDGYQEWYWGDGWVQSRLEGISLLPLSLYQTATLLRLQQSLKSADGS